MTALGAAMAVPPITAAARGAEDRALFRAAWLWDGTAPPIADAALLIKNGKIEAAGPASAIKPPPDVPVIDLGPSSSVIPGLVIAETSLSGVDIDDERALAPGVLAIDNFDFYGDYSKPLSGGVTTAQIAPGRNRLIPGQGAVVKLGGGDPEARVVLARDALRVVLAGPVRNSPRIYDPVPFLNASKDPIQPSRPQLGGSLGSAVAGLRALFRSAKEWGALPADKRPDDSDSTREELAEALKGSRLRVTATTAAEVRAAVALAKEFQLKLILVDPADLEAFDDQLASWKDVLTGVVLKADVRPGEVFDPGVPSPRAPRKRTVRETAGRLIAAGIPVALRPNSDANLDDMLYLAALMVDGKIDRVAALGMLTSRPAEILGASNRIGALKPGLDADFVVLGDDPFGTRAKAKQVFINGKPAYPIPGASASASASASAAAKSKAIVIRASEIRTGDGSTIRNGAIVVEGDKVRGLGQDVSASADAEVRAFRGDAVVVPGFIDLSASPGLGLGGGPNENPGAANPDRLVGDDANVAVARQGGVSTVLVNGPNAILALKLGNPPRILKNPVAMRFALAGDVSSAVPGLKRTLAAGKEYADSWTKYEADLVQYEKLKKEYDAAKAKYDAEQAKKAPAPAPAQPPAQPSAPAPASKPEETKKAEEPKKAEEAKKAEETKKADEPKKEEAKKAEEPKKDEAPKPPTEPKKPSADPSREPYRDLFAGRIPAIVDARGVALTKAAAELFRDEFKVRMVLANGDEAFRSADLLAEKGVGVIVGPRLVRQVERDSVNLPQVLANRQIAFGFQSQASTGVKTLPTAVGYAVRKGLGVGDAFSALTLSAAKMMSIDHRIGSLAPGKDADLVVLSGPPLAPSSRVLAVMIDGVWVYEEEETP